MCPSVDPSTCLLIDLSLYLATHLSLYLSMYLWILRCIDLSMHPSIYLPVYLSIWLSNPIAPIPCCASKTDACQSFHCVIFLRRPTVARSLSETKRMQNADATRMGQKKHHHSSVPTTTLVTTWSHAANPRARPEKTHAPLKVVLPKLVPARTVLRLQVSETKPMQKADATRMGQKKHHQSSVRTTTLVTTRSRAAKSAARPDKTHALLKAKTVCFRGPSLVRLPKTRFSHFHFGMLPLGIIVFTVSPEMKIRTAFLLIVRPLQNGPRAMVFQNLRYKNGIRRSKMLPQAPPKRRTFTKNVQQIHCLLGQCACSGHAPVRWGRAARARKAPVPVPRTSSPLLRFNAGRELLIRHGRDSDGQKNHTTGANLCAKSPVQNW